MLFGRVAARESALAREGVDGELGEFFAIWSSLAACTCGVLVSMLRGRRADVISSGWAGDASGCGLGCAWTGGEDGASVLSCRGLLLNWDMNERTAELRGFSDGQQGRTCRLRLPAAMGVESTYHESEACCATTSTVAYCNWCLCLAGQALLS